MLFARCFAASIGLLLALSQAAALRAQVPPEPATPAEGREIDADDDAEIDANPDTRENADDISPSESGASVGRILTESLDACQLDTTLLDANVQAALAERGLLVTSETIDQAGLTEPSLWWMHQQTQVRDEQEKLVVNWLALPGLQRVDLLVASSAWRDLDYLKRYGFVNRFGSVAREYGYELRVFDIEPRCVAIYNCTFAADLPQCRVNLEPPLRDSFFDW